ncbi:unnamed protein product [Peniophora sp. CBMAI 1063]|nr:unnamed protein product [Peniophora sp. CBMAI 1063]
MNKFFSFFVSAAVLATSGMAQSIAPGASVQFHSTQNPSANLCLGAVAGTQQSELLLEPCTRSLTTFKLPNGAPLNATQIQLVDSQTGPGQPQPLLCITAREAQAGNTPVILQTCDADDLLQGWRVNDGKGTGEIESTAPIMAAVCLTAVGSNQGDPVEFRNCTGAASQQWTTVVV